MSVEVVSVLVLVAAAAVLFVVFRKKDAKVETKAPAKGSGKVTKPGGKTNLK